MILTLNLMHILPSAALHKNARDLALGKGLIEYRISKTNPAHVTSTVEEHGQGGIVLRVHDSCVEVLWFKSDSMP